MIDWVLVDKNIAHCRDQFSQRKQTAINNLFQLTNFFTDEMVRKLLVYANTKEHWQQVELQEHLNRVGIGWDPESVIEEVHLVFKSLTDNLNDYFNKDYKFTGLQLWKDRSGYQIAQHYDNPRVGYSIQIYLTGNIDNLGTYFSENNITVEIPYSINAGYVTDCAQRVIHGMTIPVPKNHTRISIYGIWA